jgi:Dihydrodipicolinate synthase/N-acetylneuraminate lyase
MEGAVQMKDGFFTALGTPFDKSCSFISDSFTKQVKDQINSDVSGLLVMGSMGIEPYIKDSEYLKVAKAGVEAVKGACPVLVGVMDNSVSRVMDKVKCLEGLKIDGIVATTPFYYASSQDEIKCFFEGIADASSFPLYLYDLPGVTKTKIGTVTIEYLASKGKIKGIKTGDVVTARQLMRSANIKEDFTVIFSGLDIFDLAYRGGLKKNLDGMFSCTAPIASKLYKSLRVGDYGQASGYLDEILTLRDLFVKVGVFRGFSYAMNLLGYEGIFAPDYLYKSEENCFEEIKEYMKVIGLI